MRILYIAPYRDQQYSSACTNNIRNLLKKCELSILPIFTSNNSIRVDSDIEELENNTKQTASTSSKAVAYDAVVQHAPISYLFPFGSPVSTKNFCIPIVSYIKNIKNKHDSTISVFDKILCDSKYDSDFISDNILEKNKKIKLFSYDLKDDLDSRAINFGYLTKYYKFYTILNNENIQHIYNVLLGFSLSIDTSDSSCFILGITDKTLIDRIKKYIDFIAEKTKIDNLKYFIKLLNIEPSNTAPIHKACDCFIDVRACTNFNYEIAIAKELNKSIITNENIDISFENLLNNDSYRIGDLYPVIDIQSLVQKLKSIAKTRPVSKSDNIPKLSDIIC